MVNSLLPSTFTSIPVVTHVMQLQSLPYVHHYSNVLQCYLGEKRGRQPSDCPQPAKRQPPAEENEVAPNSPASPLSKQPLAERSDKEVHNWNYCVI